MDDLSIETFTFDYEGDPIEIFTVFGENSKKDYLYFNGIASPVQNSLNLLTEIADRGYRVWAINMPGHGKSAQIHNVTWDMMIDIVHKITKKYGIENPILSGFSMGGGLALRYASKYPDEFDSVRVVSPLCYELPSIKQLVMHGVLFTLKFANDLVSNFIGQPIPGSIYPIYYLRNYSQTLFDGALNPAKFKKLGHKIFVVTSKDDVIINVHDVKKVMKQIHGSTVKIINGFTHEMYYTGSDTITQIATDLLE